MNADVADVIASETHRRGATRRTSGVWHQWKLTAACWDDWALRDDDPRHPDLDAARHPNDTDDVDRRPPIRLRPVLMIRWRARQGVDIATIAAEVDLPEGVVRAVLDSPLTRALTVLEDADERTPE